MTYYDMQGPVQKTLPAIVAGIALFLAGAISIGGVHALGHYMGFGLVPLIVIAIWPRHANEIVSLVFVFLAGLFTDWATGGVLGQWALVFCAAWGVCRPSLRSSAFAPVGFVLIWLAMCAMAVLLISLSGWFVFGVFPDFAAMGRQVVLASLCLPLALVIRHWVGSRIGENDAWGRR